MREYELTLLVLLGLNEHLYFVAHFELRVVTELSRRNDTVRLVTNVNNYLAFVDGNNGTLNYLIVLDSIQGLVVLLNFCFVLFALLLCFIGIPVEVLERKIFCHEKKFVRSNFRNYVFT